MKIQVLPLNIKNQVINVKEDTQFVFVYLGNSKEQNYFAQDPKNIKKIEKEFNLELVFEKSGITAELLCLFALKKGEELSLATTARHKVPHTSCNTLVKGVLFDGGITEYFGKIAIEKPAQQTSSFLEDNVLVVGNSTKNRSDPILEIEADDVKASHGATTGRINKDQVYYLMSRGLTKEEAENIIVHGFFESLTGLIDDEVIRHQILDKVLVKLEN